MFYAATPDPLPTELNRAALDTLLKTQPALWRGRERYSASASIPTGFAALDSALPAQGWGIGGVTELLVEQQGIGELSLLLPALQQVAGQTTTQTNTQTNTQTTTQAAQGWAALINPPHIPYAPAFSNASIALERLLIISSDNDTNTLWATEQVLRSRLFGAVVAWVHKSSAQRQRRLQLAAEAGGSWATVYRPLHAHKEHSPVSTRICLGMNQQQLTLDIIKVRAGSPQTVTLHPEEFDASQGAEWPVPRAQPALRDIRGLG